MGVPMTKMNLTRHDQVEWITPERFCDRADLPLTDQDEEGRRRLPYLLGGEDLHRLAAEAP
jgi:hypothetical protein